MIKIVRIEFVKAERGKWGKIKTVDETKRGEKGSEQMDIDIYISF